MTAAPMTNPVTVFDVVARTAAQMAREGVPRRLADLAAAQQWAAWFGVALAREARRLA